MEEAALCAEGSADLAEWRADCLEQTDGMAAAPAIAERLRGKLDGRPLLFTYRRREEGETEAFPWRTMSVFSRR